MKCPKCSSKLESLYVTKEYIIDECPDCHGMWFDKHELEQLLEVKDSGIFDRGATKDSKRLSLRTEVECPRCKKAVLSTVAHSKQKQLNYELCPSCQGIWLDGGELKELKKENILNFFSAFFNSKE